MSFFTFLLIIINMNTGRLLSTKLAMDIPKTMRSLVAPRKCRPDSYEVVELPVPSITLPTQVLLRMHAAAANTGELQAVTGKLALFHTPK